MSTGPVLDAQHPPALVADLGQEPLPLLVAPRTAEAVAGVLREATPDQGIVPLGGGTALGVGAPLEPVGQLLSLRHMDRVLHHSVEDLVVTVEAGLSWSALQAALAPTGQWLPMEPPDAGRATVGGMIAAAAPSLLSASQGTLRDALLGVRLAWPDGQVTKAGGQVVKNVSGYDLMKLVHGSQGTLAVVVEASLRLRARPARDVLWSARVDSLNRALELARTTCDALRAPPAALHLVAAEGAAGPMHLVVRLQGASAAVEAEGQRLTRLWSAASLEPQQEDVVPEQARPERLAQMDRVMSRGDDVAVVQTSLVFRRSHLDAVVESHQQFGEALGQAVPFLVDLLSGQLHARGVMPALSASATARWCAELTSLRERLHSHQAFLVRHAAPASIRARVPAWVRAPLVARQEARIRQEFDPHRRLSPGRLDWTDP